MAKYKEKKITIDEKITHRDIANLSAMTRETTSREWEKLQKRGLLTYENYRITINDADALEKELTT